MQKARQNIRVKWMFQDLIHEISGCSNVGWQRSIVRAERDHWNRDRPGGHRHTDLMIKSVENIFKDEVGTARRKSIKKANRKAQRINHKKVIAECVHDYMESVHEIYTFGDEIADYDEWMDLITEEWDLYDHYESEPQPDWDDQFYDSVLEYHYTIGSRIDWSLEP